MSGLIHPTAVVHSGAQLAEGVRIGPYSVIGEHVVLGTGCQIGSHVILEGRTTVGEQSRIFHHCSIGEIPQDMKYQGEPTQLQIGRRNTIRECCTLNIGTAQGGGVTRLGDDNWIMAYVHVAHDCQIGHHVILANAVQLGGHVTIGDWAILGGMSAVHQFVRVGDHCMSRGGTILVQDLPPFVTAAGNIPSPSGVNSEGLKRRGFSADAIATIRQAYKILYRSQATMKEACQQIAELVPACPQLQLLVDFLAIEGRGIVR